MESLLTWGLGICFTGFCVLLALHGKLNDAVNKKSEDMDARLGQKIEDIKVDMEKRVTFDWIEKKIDREFETLNKAILLMNDALVGTVEKRGIITMFHHHEDRLKLLEEARNNCSNCKKNPLNDHGGTRNE